jgi:aspartyl-tRNA(Asn)/glutamyl-tRNA(Gln) amidotransferase subunit A
MGVDEGIVWLSIAEAAAAVQRRELSPVDLTEAYLARIERLNPLLNAYITVTVDEARREARRAEAEIAAGGYRGPLHGIPLGIKDIIATAGVRTTSGSRFFAEHVPDEDATVIARLRDAGMVLLGKHNTHEFASGNTTMNPHFGACRNPWDPERIPGGSSGGSAAAVASALCMGAVGSDTGGSIRTPSALCGVAGIKPTYGLVSRAGVTPLSWSMDHVGPIARRVEDLAILLEAIAGPDPRDPASASRPAADLGAGLRRGVDGLRVGLLRGPQHDRAGEEARATVTAACRTFERLGARVDEVTPPLLDEADAISFTILYGEMAAYHEGRLRAHPDWFGADVRQRVEAGAALRAVDYIQAQRARTLFIAALDELFTHVDVLALPSTPTTAPRIGPEAGAGLRAYPSPTRLFNVSGHPALSFPCGFGADGLPLGLQLAGRAFDEAALLRAAFAFEQSAEPRRPPEAVPSPSQA